MIPVYLCFSNDNDVIVQTTVVIITLCTVSLCTDSFVNKLMFVSDVLAINRDGLFLYAQDFICETDNHSIFISLVLNIIINFSFL